jgi:hypothetical protein
MAVQYEYKVQVVHKVEELEQRLNEGAPEGWELDRVFMAEAMRQHLGGGQTVWVVFRRPVSRE